MRLSLFGKERATQEGKRFNTYTTRLFKKSTAETITVSVKFVQPTVGPDLKDLPANIVVSRDKMSLQEKEFTRTNGDGSPMIDEITGLAMTGISRTLWVKQWKFSNVPYVDTSLDDYGSDSEDGENEE